MEAMTPTCSIIIPARNEEAFLPNCLLAIKSASERARITPEIIVVLNRCTDRTETIALEHDCRTVVENAKNLAIIRNAGIAAATSELVITIDADSRMSKNMLKDILECMNNDKWLGGGVLMYPDRISLGIALTYLCLTPYVIWHKIAGGLFFFRKSAWQEIGGFNPEWKSAEDIDFAIRLKQLAKHQTKKFKILKSSWIITSTRKFDSFGDWYYLKHYRELRSLLKGKNAAAADRLWYDVKR